MTEPIRYTVRFPERTHHYIEVEASFPCAGRQAIEVFLAVWTPGSYLIREYSRHMEGVTASEEVVKISKNRWRVQTNGVDRCTFNYRLYCREMSVRTNWVEQDFAMLNGAPTFVTLVDDYNRPHEVHLELPPEWATAISGLESRRRMEDAACIFFAPEYDTLVDSPILAGNPSIYRFEIEGIPHFIANQGEGGVWNAAQAVADVQRIVQQYREMWGGLPYTKFVFLNILVEAGGGLEHRNSMCIMASRWATRTAATYRQWLGLVSHEFMHVWNVKRLRPVELGPFDYERENYTRSLWVAEGFTEYYGDLMLRRAGLLTDAEYLGSLLNLVNILQTTPGRLVHPVAESSFDAWIKLYRPDENSLNSTISYYTKGAVVAWLLDARIRRLTGGTKSLDDLMRLAYARFAGTFGYTQQQFIATAEEVAGGSLEEFFRRTVFSCDELDYREALEWFDLRWGSLHACPRKAWLGAETKTDSGRLFVTRIPQGTPAAASELNADDEIVAIDDYRIRADQLYPRLEQYRPGETVLLLVARRDRLMCVKVTLGEEPKKWQLEPLFQAVPS